MYAALIARSMRHYWRSGMLLLFGIAVATAVITGSLLVGHSVTASLRDMALARLGSIDDALIAPGFFREELAAELRANPSLHGKIARIDGLLFARGSAEHAESDAIVPNVQAVGVEQTFWQAFPGQAPALSGRNVAINAALARDLHLGIDDDLLVNLPKQSAIPTNTLFAYRQREKTLRTVRLRITAILPDTGAGGFSLNTESATPRNVFIDRHWIAGQLEKDGQLNALVATRASHDMKLDAALRSALADAATLDDYGLRLIPHVDQGYVMLSNTGLVLTEAQVTAARQAATRCGARANRTSVYLANTIRITGTGKALAYALLAGAEDFPQGPVADAIWLNRWAADDLQAKPGDRVQVEYLLPTRDGDHRTATLDLTIGGIVPLEGQAADAGIVPHFDGITGADRPDEWDPPFPVEMDRVTPRDEAYWEQYRATPKAWIGLATAQKIWTSGSEGAGAHWITGIRLTPRHGQTVQALAAAFPRTLQAALPPAQAGLTFQPVRDQAIAAAKGSTDFGQLFIALSFFLILAAAGLAGMIMRLMIDRRSSDMGIMLANGFSPASVTRVLLLEGLLWATGGAILGMPLGILYTRGIIRALATSWNGAVGAVSLSLHVDAGSLCIGLVSGLIVGLAAMLYGIRHSRRQPVLRLLAGWQSTAIWQSDTPAKWRWAVPALLLFGALALHLPGSRQALSATGAFFGSGTLLLIAGLMTGGLSLRTLRTMDRDPSLIWLVLRSAAMQSSRSLMIIGLVTSASFLIVVVAANARNLSRMDWTRRASGTGGFALHASSSVPIPYDFGTAAGRAHLNFSPEDDAAFRNTQVYACLLSPGEDISCVNMTRPTTPRLLGVNAAMIARGGFTVTTGQKVSNPWMLLTMPQPDGTIPAFGDADSVEWTLHRKLGDVLTVPGPNGNPVRLRLVGLISGSIFAGELLVSEASFSTIYPTIDASRVFLLDVPPAQVQAVTTSLRENLGDLGIEVRTTGELLHRYLRVQNTYLSTFLTLGGLGLLLGTLGIVVVLLRGAVERRREFAVMLATGFDTAAIARVLLLENAGLLLAGMAMGCLTALVAVLPQLSSAEAQVNWSALFAVLTGMLLIGLVSCLVAARGAIRAHLITALREE